MTLRKLTLATVATVALASSAFAADQNTANGQWGVGAGVFTNDGTTTGAVATYLNNMFIVQGGLGYTNASASPYDVERGHGHIYDTHLSFGLRDMMNNQVSLDYGVAGAYGFLTKKAKTQKDPYSIGAFVGVDFEPVQNILLTASIQPYTYSRDSDSDKTSRILSVGAISVSYLF